MHNIMVTVHIQPSSIWDGAKRNIKPFNGCCILQEDLSQVRMNCQLLCLKHPLHFPTASSPVPILLAHQPVENCETNVYQYQIRLTPCSFCLRFQLVVWTRLCRRAQAVFMHCSGLLWHGIQYVSSVCPMLWPGANGKLFTRVHIKLYIFLNSNQIWVTFGLETHGWIWIADRYGLTYKNKWSVKAGRSNLNTLRMRCSD